MKNIFGCCILTIVGLVAFTNAGASEQLDGTSFGIGQAYIDGATFSNKLVTYENIDGIAVLEGDIILGSVAALNARPITSAVVIAGNNFRWPRNVVPFLVDAGVPAAMRSQIDAAIAHWRANTHITFVTRTTEADFVQFVSGTGCSSYVGRQTGRQNITLEVACGTGAVIHEIGHAVGLWHEQSREDRDMFVVVHLANVLANQRHNFNQHITDGDDVGAYDYGSIMHYRRTAFSSNGQPTIEPITNGVVNNNIAIGQRTGLSTGDLAAINALYPLLLPIAIFETTGSARMNETVSFNASKSYDPQGAALTYNWNFGDGSTFSVGCYLGSLYCWKTNTLSATNPLVTHAFSQTGTYHVSLSVSDGTDVSVTVTKNVVVYDPKMVLPPVINLLLE